MKPTSGLSGSSKSGAISQISWFKLGVLLSNPQTTIKIAQVIGLIPSEFKKKDWINSGVKESVATKDIKTK